MAFSYGFYNSKNGDKRYDARQIGEMFDGVIMDGVFSSIGNHFMVRASDDGKGVIVGSGRAWFNHTWNKNDSDLYFALPEPDLTGVRYDALVLDINSDIQIRENSIKWVQGTPVIGSTPNKPTMIHTETHNQYPLCYIYRLSNKYTISNNDIDNRYGTSELPITTGILNSFNNDTFFEAFKESLNNSLNEIIENTENEVNSWLEQIQQLDLNENVLANMLDIINNMDNKKLDTNGMNSVGDIFCLPTKNFVMDFNEKDNISYENNVAKRIEKYQQAYILDMDVDSKYDAEKVFDLDTVIDLGNFKSIEGSYGYIYKKMYRNTSAGLSSTPYTSGGYYIYSEPVIEYDTYIAKAQKNLDNGQSNRTYVGGVLTAEFDPNIRINDPDTPITTYYSTGNFKGIFYNIIFNRERRYYATNGGSIDDSPNITISASHSVMANNNYGDYSEYGGVDSHMPSLNDIISDINNHLSNNSYYSHCYKYLTDVNIKNDIFIIGYRNAIELVGVDSDSVAHRSHRYDLTTGMHVARQLFPGTSSPSSIIENPIGPDYLRLFNTDIFLSDNNNTELQDMVRAGFIDRINNIINKKIILSVSGDPGSYLYDFKIFFLPTIKKTSYDSDSYELAFGDPKLCMTAKWHLSQNISNLNVGGNNTKLNEIPYIKIRRDSNSTVSVSRYAQSYEGCFVGANTNLSLLPSFNVTPIFDIISKESYIYKTLGSQSMRVTPNRINSFFVGRDNNPFGNYIYMFGRGLLNAESSENIIMGKYNDPYVKNTILSLGNGNDDNNRFNALDIYKSGSIRTNGAQYSLRGICRGKLVNTDDAPVFDLEDGAVYELTVNGRLKSTGAYRGFTKWLIAAPFDPNGIGLTTTALAAPVSATLGSAGTAVVSGFNTNLRQEYTAYKPDGTEITAYHARLGIGSCTTDCWFQWSFVKVSGSVADFEEEWGE